MASTNASIQLVDPTGQADGEIRIRLPRGPNESDRALEQRLDRVVRAILPIIVSYAADTGTSITSTEAEGS